jgi:hypothetical protein
LAIGDAYANNTKYKAIIGKASGDNDTEIDAQLLAMSRVMEKDCFGGRYFTKDTAVTTRRYYPRGSGQQTLTVEDIASTAGLIVKVDDSNSGTASVSLTVGTDYVLLPLNALTGPEPAPYTELYLPGSGRTSWPYLVEVTAIHGWPAIPEAIAQATCQLVARLRLEGPRATERIQEGIDAVIGTSREARSIVNELIEAYAAPPVWVRP